MKRRESKPVITVDTRMIADAGNCVSSVDNTDVVGLVRGGGGRVGSRGWGRGGGGIRQSHHLSRACSIDEENGCHY